MITIKPEILEELFLSELREWSRVRKIDSEEFQKLSDYLSELAYCIDGEVNPIAIVEEIYLTGIDYILESEADYDNN